MAKFCGYCGSPLKEEYRFCVACGKQIPENHSKPPSQVEPVSQMQPRQVQPAPQMQPGQVQPAPQMQPRQVQQAPQNIGGMAVSTARTAVSSAVGTFAGQFAPSVCGETVLGSFGNPIGVPASLIPGTGTVLLGSFKRFFASLKSAFKNPKKLIVPLVLAAIWLVLDVLQILKINFLPTRVLSFLTFAKGGMSGRFSGFIGGIFGKGIYAGALMTLINSLIRKNKGQKRSLRDTFRGIFGVSLDSLGGYLTGIGAAMFIYLFISGNMIKSGFMAGIAAAYLSAKACLNRGFLQNLIGSFTSKGKAALSQGAAGIIKGLTVGFASAAVLGQIRIKLLLIILGALLMVGGIVLMILQKAGVIKSKKGVQ